MNVLHVQGYVAVKGVNGTWDQLAGLSPNIPIYRSIKKQFRRILKPVWQGTAHTKTSSSNEIRRIRAKFKENQLHRIRKDPTITLKAAETEDRDTATSKEKIAKRQTTRKTLDVMENGRTVLQKRAFKAWEKRYIAYVNGDAEVLEDDLVEVGSIE